MGIVCVTRRSCICEQGIEDYVHAGVAGCEGMESVIRMVEKERGDSICVVTGWAGLPGYILK